MPVGQAVTATSARGRRRWRCGGAAVPAAGERLPPRRPCPRRARRGRAVGRAGRGGGGRRRGATSSASLMRATTSSASSASRSALVKAGLTSERASLVSSCRWVASPPGRGGDEEGQVGGTVLGPEVDAAGSAGRRRASARRPPVVRQCGIAMPPGRPVGEVSSRANASATSWSASAARPASPTTAARPRITSCLSSPHVASRRTSSLVIRSVMRCLPGGGDGDELGAKVRRLGDRGAGQGGGGAAVGHGEGEAVRGGEPADVARGRSRRGWSRRRPRC